MGEPETSLEQNALIRLSNLISLRNTQQLTSIIATTSVLFWTFIYPILMLLLLIFVFSKNTTEIFYFNNIIGLMGLLIISSAIFGLTQAITSLRIA